MRLHCKRGSRHVDYSPVQPPLVSLTSLQPESTCIRRAPISWETRICFSTSYRATPSTWRTSQHFSSDTHQRLTSIPTWYRCARAALLTLGTPTIMPVSIAHRIAKRLQLSTEPGCIRTLELDLLGAAQLRSCA